ncbi:septation protein SepH [uncultured Bifidobacterium sp.]|uniref:septation protein SepH n=1 Tax=uncultured Bifidobacterium sp. TaxID=165187 RepID=UPI0028DCFEE9|nr:septation protein SepH [uncultured Bifidobacterium sp.]
MPDNSPMRARFDHVDGNGDLVFVIPGASFAVTPDDAFDDAIERSRRIRHGRPGGRRPASASPIPIARIQSMVRAGATPRAVADELGIDESTVERFSPIVETEKNYAIDRFLESPASSDHEGVSVGDLIHRSLTLRDADMKSLSWNATRHDVDPWRITAEFDVAGRHIRAIWSWSPQDRAIGSLNTTARALLNEVVRRRVASRHEPDQPHEAAASRSTRLVATSAAPVDAADGPIDGDGVPAVANASTAADEGPKESAPNRGSVVPTPVQEKPRDGGDPIVAVVQPLVPETGSDDPDFVRTSHRRKGRSAVPSWDEILFGD